jgi:uncharacterized membrane protein
MVDIRQTEQQTGWQFVLRPNRSLSWEGVVRFFLALFGVSMTIAVGLAFMGYWLVLPFSGLEMIALAAALYLVARRSHLAEVIEVAGDDVQIERGCGQPTERCKMSRYWSRVRLEKVDSGGQPTRLLICSHGHAEEVGRFLSESERQDLAVRLSSVLGGRR